jgi:hypothetical protein
MITRKLATVMWALLSIGCTAENARTSLPPPPASVAATSLPDSSPPKDWSDSIEAKELAGIRAAAGKVSRVGAELRIQLLNGRTAVFKDDTTALSVQPVSRYAGYLKGMHSHVVHLVPYEGSGTYLILDDSTGDSTTVSGEPVLSPDGTRFVLTSSAGVEDTDASVIEVWRMVGRSLENEFSDDTKHEPWEPSDPVWRDSLTIDFIKNSGDDPGHPVKTSGHLTRTGTTWVLSESPH